jgi:hypothetical protein
LAEDPSITPASRGHDIREAQPIAFLHRADTEAESDADLRHKSF